ncbi:MAG: NUDIX hydrolase [Desulfobacterales bacterium]|nr:NUDIX hydrolase [Desulfobacterales bacterium]MBS3756612.1 NUDIX hydrolase [Desulfobacterales bacterium]
MNYCTHCGHLLNYEIPHGDDRPRHVCPSCGMIHYQNPKMVVGCIAESENRILLCRRSIDPAYGRWTIPAGYLENRETVEAGARREAREEARANLGELVPYRLFTIPHISQMYLIFRAKLLDDHFSAGEESLETRLFGQNEIPWDELAFRVVFASLKDFIRDREAGAFSFDIKEIPPEDGSSQPGSPDKISR